ncbi:MAG: helix-turn-helix domain-containing protein [Candidatus Heimdallarchaeota archaeon]
MSPKTFLELMEPHELSIDDIFSCMLNIRPLEVQTYIEVLRGANTVHKIAERINRNKSTAQRLLNRLMVYGLVARQSISRKETGYYYIYQALPPEKVRDLLMETLDKTYKKIYDYLANNWLILIETQLNEKKDIKLTG